MLSYFRATFFEDDSFLPKEEFVVEQEELVLDKALDNDKHSFMKVSVSYECALPKVRLF